MSINPNNQFAGDELSSFYKTVELLKSLGKKVYCDAGEDILTEGGICNFFFYVESGKFRAFRWINDREVNIGFSFKGDLDTCPYSFINNKPSRDTIQALCKSEVIKIYRNNLDDLIKSYPESEPFVAYMLSGYIETLVNRFIELKAFTAEEIYLKLVREQPVEITGIPLMYLASYLGISKERLSRIRKKHAHLI